MRLLSLNMKTDLASPLSATLGPTSRLAVARSRVSLVSAFLLLALGCSQAPPPEDTDTSDTTADTTIDTSGQTTTGPGDTTADSTDETTAPTDTTVPEPTTDTTDSDTTTDTTTDTEPVPTGVEPEPPKDPLNYFPVGDGYEWSYDHIDGLTEMVDWVEEVSVEATTWNGQSAWKVQDSPDAAGVFDVQTWVLNADRIERVHRDEFQGNTLRASVDYTPGFTRFAAAWTTQGYTETITYTRDAQDASGSVDSKLRFQKYEVEAVGESVEVQGETYDDCLVITRVRVDENGDIQTDAANNPDSTTRYWYCYGVGKVKEENLVSGSREELTSYSF